MIEQDEVQQALDQLVTARWQHTGLRPETPGMTRPGVLSRARLWLGKALGGDPYAASKAEFDSKYEQLQQIVGRAERQGAVVNLAYEMLRMYDDPRGIKDKTDLSFTALRDFAHRCDPLVAIVNRRTEQIAAFCDPVQTRWGKAMEPGFRIRLTQKSEKATAEDTKTIEMLQQYFSECGFCPPPKSERPENWQPGFSHFLKQIARDSMELDWVTVRRWQSDTRPEKYPIVCFAAEDSALIRRRARQVIGVQDGTLITRDSPSERANLREEAVFAKTTEDAAQIVADFTAEELFAWVRNPRTDEWARGYGMSEAEMTLEGIKMWLDSKQYNASRHQKDSLPRGFLTLIGNASEEQVKAFTLRWKQMLTGVSNRWAIPIMQATPGQGSAATWTEMDKSNRDMEYKEWMFMLAIWLHANYRIHPEETGYQAFSPFRPPLSESSPEASLKYSQDTGLRSVMKSLAAVLNREVLWVMYPSRRYTFEFVGLGDFNELEDVQTSMARLQSGLSTPRQEWDARDTDMPAIVRAHPAADLPMPFAMGVQFIQQSEQLQLQMEQMKAQMMQVERQNAMAQLMAGQPGMGGPGAAPVGGQSTDIARVPLAPGGGQGHSDAYALPDLAQGQEPEPEEESEYQYPEPTPQVFAQLGANR